MSNYDRGPRRHGEADGLRCLCARHPTREKAESFVRGVAPGGLSSLAGARFYREDVLGSKKLITQT